MYKFFLIVAMLVTTIFLILGLLNMFRSGKKSKNLSNKFMVWRIWVQGLALIIFALGLYFKGN
jgi:ABC-type Fe3+ transport system permease subunit